MVLTLLPTAALATAEQDVKLPDAQNGTIKLDKDLTLTNYAHIKASSNVTTLDLNGYTLSFAGTGDFPATLYVSGCNLTIKNGTITNEAAFA